MVKQNKRREPDLGAKKRALPRPLPGQKPVRGRPVKRGGKPQSPTKKPRPDKQKKSSPIVPSQAIAGRALTLVVAIMSFLACLTVGSVSVVNDAANDWTNDLVREVTVQIRPADGINMMQEIEKTLALVQEFSGVGGARALSNEETGDLLQPWLGAGLSLEELPIPRLILVEINEPALFNLAEMKEQVEKDIRAATVDDHRLWTRQLSAMANGVVVGGLVILVLVLFSMVLSVVFATRAAMSGNKDVVEVLHFVGAEDRFIAGEFQRHFLVLGLKGGVIGGAVACLCFFVFGLLGGSDAFGFGGGQLQALIGPFSVGAPGYFGVLAIVFLVAVLTALTSRLAVHSHLAEID